MICNAGKGPVCNLWTTQSLISLQVHCPLTESMDTVVYVDEQRMLRSDCIDAHADLDLCCLQIALGPFLCVENQAHALEHGHL